MLEEFKDFSLSAEQKKRADEINAEIRTLKDDMIKHDEKIKGILEIKMQECKNEIREVKAQKKRTIGYGGLDYSAGSMYFNKTN
jgi:hypothetical protein